jgi:hypothetical protein
MLSKIEEEKNEGVGGKEEAWRLKKGCLHYWIHYIKL